MASPLALVGLLVLVGFAAWAASSGPVGPPAPALQTELPAQHPVVIHQPAGPPVIDTGLRDAKGQPITANCTTCHATREANRTTNDGAQLVDFHTGLHSNHGGLTCVSCHNDEENYSSLHRADGRPIAFEKQIQLCAQCHGPQHRDYVNGSHGGMTGYWDLTRGGRTRNTCTDCHDPHAPQIPLVQPVFAPRDRFLPPAIDHVGPQEGLIQQHFSSEPAHE
ncbi:MAG: hypothetical protein V3V20_08825 [Algisphaera sp.]